VVRAAGEEKRIVMREPFWCRPCADRCIFDQPYCLRTISIEQVLQGAQGGICPGVCPRCCHGKETELFLLAPSVTFAMRTDAKRYQVVYHIATKPAPGFHVMDLQAFHRTALLTPPAISFEHACPDDCVFFRIQFESRSFVA